MKKIDTYVIQVKKENSHLMILPGGLKYETIKIDTKYLCYIPMYNDEPIIMYTNKIKEAVYYTQHELINVQNYLDRKKIKYETIKVNDHHNNKKNDDIYTKITEVIVNDFI